MRSLLSILFVVFTLSMTFLEMRAEAMEFVVENVEHGHEGQDHHDFKCKGHIHFGFGFYLEDLFPYEAQLPSIMDQASFEYRSLQSTVYLSGIFRPPLA
jgi:hypothetical protein